MIRIKKGLNLRMTERRLNKLRLYAASKEKTMTQLVEDWIDRLPSPESDDSSNISSSVDCKSTEIGDTFVAVRLISQHETEYRYSVGLTAKKLNAISE